MYVHLESRFSGLRTQDHGGKYSQQTADSRCGERRVSITEKPGRDGRVVVFRWVGRQLRREVVNKMDTAGDFEI